jgi:hypothetical protein
LEHVTAIYGGRRSMSKETEWVANTDVPAGKDTTRQEFQASTGSDQFAIETTPSGDGELTINRATVAQVHDEETPLQAFQDLESSLSIAARFPDKVEAA